MYTRLLIPTDGSPCSELGIRHGLRLAKLTGAEVILLHVIEPVTPPTHAGIPAVADFETHLETVRRTGSHALAAAERQAREAGVSARVQMTGPSDPAEGIVEVAESESCDLIVMGSHGRSGLRRLILGSVTESVLRKITRTLLIVHCSGEDPGLGGVRKG